MVYDRSNCGRGKKRRRKKRDEIDSSETAMQTTVIAIPLAKAIGPCVNKMHLRRGGRERKEERKKERKKERKEGREKKKVVIIHGGLILTTVAFFGPSITMC